MRKVSPVSVFVFIFALTNFISQNMMDFASERTSSESSTLNIFSHRRNHVNPKIKKQTFWNVSHKKASLWGSEIITESLYVSAAGPIRATTGSRMWANPSNFLEIFIVCWRAFQFHSVAQLLIQMQISNMWGVCSD